jgi:surface antigen
MKITTLTIITTLLLTSACTKEQFGTGIGAVSGALIGSAFGKGSGKIAATALGGIFGAVAGNKIGQAMDESDKKHYVASSQDTFEKTKTGGTKKWVNPDTGNHGTTHINHTYQNKEGRYCREFTQKIYVGNKESEGYGTACRQPDGAWEIVSR